MNKKVIHWSPKQGILDLHLKQLCSESCWRIYIHLKGIIISYERLLSEPGLINIYNALAGIYQLKSHAYSAAEIAQNAIEYKDVLCAGTLAMFFEILGQFSGDLALVTGAHAGIYIGGEICQRYPEWLQKSRFRESFEQKG